MDVAITPTKLAKQLGKSVDKVYAWAKRENDPLPIRYVDGERYGSILVSEFESWFKRSGKLKGERGLDG